jgi:hypothetical protein
MYYIPLVPSPVLNTYGRTRPPNTLSGIRTESCGPCPKHVCLVCFQKVVCGMGFGDSSYPWLKARMTSAIIHDSVYM